ncbi:GNAT family N-acetyltransferase [Sediminibacillus massiliensis]|uniref:GNAT family N-acetyltransferase n=1 Tax=Sediminibacillus massiliensis TaxID=1926277 RepID=UPI0009888509|nr:GNAT family N-acetyltransferase [Sediminibacillus massiliensis]
MEIKTTETDQELKEAYNVRNIVFVEEQKVPAELEIDDLEDESIHFVGYEDGGPVAASRLRFVDEYGKLERICVLKDYRGRSLGSNIIQEMEAVIKSKGYQKAKLNAQTRAVKFYESLGYRTVSGEFMDAGIPHVTMTKNL